MDEKSKNELRRIQEDLKELVSHLKNVCRDAQRLSLRLTALIEKL